MSTVLDRPTARPAVGPVAASSVPARPRPSEPLFVLVGGVPGAGKTTALARVRAAVPDVVVLDPERYRDRFAGGWGRRLPYRAYRPLVHTVHALGVLLLLLRGPRRLRSRALVVHEPATRPRRAAALARLLRARGWRSALVLVDADRAEALAGQQARGRVVDPASFARHWQRWTQQRDGFVAAHRTGAGVPGWGSVVVVRREDAADRLRALLADA